MKILISPVGNQDPFGKPDKVTGEFTQGSAVAICEFVQPDKVILLPTHAEDGNDTVKKAEETKEWIESNFSAIADIHPVSMVAANDYSEAIREYGTRLRAIADEFSTDELLLNASSGTPAIKLACLLVVAEGLVNATPYYADDPTQSRKQKNEHIYSLDVAFLRESALVQRTQDLLKHGQFRLAQEPLRNLAEGAFHSARKVQARRWLRLTELLDLWDERRYNDAHGRLRKLRGDWQDAPKTLKLQLKAMEDRLNILCSAERTLGTMSWDIYFHTLRLKTQGHLTACVEQFWIAIENAAFENLRHNYSSAPDDLIVAVRELAEKDAAVETLLRSRIKTTSYRDCFRELRKRRNACIHQGDIATLSLVTETDDLTKKWLVVAGCPEPPSYPLSTYALQDLSLLFY